MTIWPPPGWASGFRFICGDWNRGPHDLHTFNVWRQAGWEEVQLLALQRFSRPLTPTSKHAAYSDQIWVSPELAAHLTEVTLLEEVFSEHDPLYATFQIPCGPLHQWHWPMPAKLPWDQAPDNYESHATLDESALWHDSSRAYASWSAAVERDLERHFDDAAVPLPRGAFGRGQTTTTIKRPMQLSPLHHGRHGDEAPCSDLLNRSVHHWFKQLRRFQAYVQRSNSALPPSGQADQLHTWKRIWHAAGFRGGFSRWWKTRGVQLHGSPTDVPYFPPSLATAQIMFVDFKANFKKYEQWQLSRGRSMIQASAFDHARILYKQLKAVDMSPPEWFCLHFETLIGTTSTDCQVELVDDITLPATATWTLQGEPVEIEVLAPSMVRLHTDLILAPGQVLAGKLRVYDFETMEEALNNLWQPIWNRHLDIPHERWQRAFAFASSHLPRGLFPPLKWTGAKVSAILRSYKKRTATGPDGWSRLDLASLPTEQHHQISRLFELIQAGVQWPVQMVTGFVCPVKKIEDAERPSEYRPIILMSMTYRLWAAGASRSILPSLGHLAGPHIYGFVSSQRASDLWFLVQASIEYALQGNRPFGGFNLDLIKAFNRLPREPLFHGLRCLGIPDSLCQSWMSALSLLQRRFRVGQDIGPPRTSVTGYPEGDPLSCCVMVSFNILMDTYMSLFAGECLVTSFVDNIQLLCDDPPALHRCSLVAQVFLQMFDLDLDVKKSYAWGTDASFRRQMRSFGYQIKLAERDLGAQMTFSNVRWTQSGNARVESISHFWMILKRSPMHAWFKIRALCTAGWTKALHGCENRPAASSTLAKLRSQAMTALGWRHAGASPLVRWTLQQTPEADPEYFQLWSIVRTFWRMLCTYPHLRHYWSSFLGDPPSRGQGPFHAMHQVCQQLGWSWRTDLALDVGFLVVQFMDMHLGLLKTLLLHAWDRYVASCLQHRSDFRDLQTVDRTLSFRRPDLAVQDQALLATIQDGTFYTNWQIAKFDQSRLPLCSLCGVEDDLAHRCVACPRYQAVRDLHRPCISRWDPELPSFTLHGLSPENPYMTQWWTYLQTLPSGLHDFGWHLSSPCQVDLFTDGSCFDSSLPMCRAAWAVVSLEEQKVVASAPLAGLCQSVNRAELSAVLAALHWKLLNPCELRIWSDSSYVVLNFQHLLTAQVVPLHWAHQDLWQQALSLIPLIDWDSCRILKVQAHRDLQCSTSPMEDWLIAGNDLADRAAKRQNQHRAQEALHLLESMCMTQMHLERRVRSQQDFLLAIAHQDLHSSTPTTEFDPEEISIAQLGGNFVTNDCFVAAAVEVCVDSEIGAIHPFEGAFLGDLARWLFGVDLISPYKQTVSLFELALAFELEFGTFPVWIPRNGRSIAVYDSQSSLGALIRPTMAGAASLLKRALKVLFSFASSDLALVKATRLHLGVSCPVWCLEIGWPVEVSTRVDSIVSSFASRGIRHQRDLARPYQHLLR